LGGAEQRAGARQTTGREKREGRKEGKHNFPLLEM